MTRQIESPQNPRIKELQRLAKRRRRDEKRITIVEGVREVTHALKFGPSPIEAYICPPLLDLWPNQLTMAQTLQKLESLATENDCRLYTITTALYEKIAYRGESGGIILVIPYLLRNLGELPKTDHPFLLVVENVEKPGNLGAILRTADAANVDGIIVTHSPENSPTDIHNPNTIRASLGTIFCTAIAQSTTANAIHWLQANGISIVTTSPDANTVYSKIDMKGPVSIVMGSEAHGVSHAWFEAADHKVHIPMHGFGDSLNLSTSTAIMLYELLRQRFS